MKGFLFLILLPFTLFAQERIVFEDDFKKSFHTKPKLDFKFDNRFSFIRNYNVKTIGIKVGLNFNRKFKVGIGINQMLFPVKKKYLPEDGLFVPVELDYFYFSPYLEYVYFNSKKWEFSLSAQFGIGGANYNHIDVNGQKVKLVESLILSYEPAMLIDYKIIRWFGIGTGVGFRLVYYKSLGIEQQFSSPEYIVKLKVYLGEIVRTITGKQLEID